VESKSYLREYNVVGGAGTFVTANEFTSGSEVKSKVK
jgi:hypothetical protein